jgi:hypothetical protein
MTRSGAEWLRIDLMDGFWQFSAWSQAPIEPKTESMAAAVRGVLVGAEGVLGVVLSSGSTAMAQAQPARATVDGAHGLVRGLGNFKGREALIIPMIADAEAEALAWVRIYDSKPSWLDAALGEPGWHMSVLTAMRDVT